MKVKICNWKACKSRFCSYIEDRLIAEKERFKLENLEIERTACLWECKKWPNIDIDWEIINYTDPVKAANLVNKKK